MGWLTGQRSSSTYICPEDRYVVKNDPYTSYAPPSEDPPRRLHIQRSYVCPTCDKPLINMGTRWRAPKKINDKAWKRILKGDIWWDDKAIDSKINKARNKWQPWSGKRKRPAHYYTQSSEVRRAANNIEYINDHMIKYYLKQMVERDDRS